MEAGYTHRKIQALPLVLLLCLLVVLASVSIHKIYLGYDSIGHYVRIWFIHQSLFSDGVLPLTNRFLEGGRAVAYPYGFLPYTSAALLFQYLSDRAVTIMMVTAVISLISVVSLTRLKRDPVLIAAFVAFMPFVDGLLSFQLVFFWAACFFFLYVWAMEKGRWLCGFVLMLATVTTHPLLGAEAVALYNLWLIITRPLLRRRLILMSIAVVLVMIPLYLYVIRSPSAVEAPKGLLMAKAAMRSLRGLALVFLPFVLLRFRALVHSYQTVILTLLGLTTLLWFLTGQNSFVGLLQDSRSMYGHYFDSEAFQASAIYRVMEPGPKEDGQYYFVQRGAVLSNDFFTESMFRQSWGSTLEYKSFLVKQGIDHVVIEAAYIQWFKTNELDLLRELVRTREAEIIYTDPGERFTVFDVKL